MPVVKLTNASLGYGRKVILKDLNVSIHKGERLGIIGPNGSGKTTFLKGVLGLIQPLNGNLYREKNLKIGYVKQDHSVHTLYPFTAFEVAFMGLEPIKPFAAKKGNLIEKTEKALDFTASLHLRNELFRTLSGGQKQRVLIARALAGEPSVLVLDEPVSDLDSEGMAEVSELLHNIYAEKRITILIVSHLLDIVLANTDRCLIIKGEKVEQHTTESFSKGLPFAAERSDHVVFK